MEMFTYHSLIRTVGQKDPLKCNWSSDVYPVLFDILQPNRFKVLVETGHMMSMSNVPSSLMLDVLNVIKSLICLDSSKRATVFDVSTHKFFRGKIKKSQKDEILVKKPQSRRNREDDWTISSESLDDCREFDRAEKIAC